MRHYGHDLARFYEIHLQPIPILWRVEPYVVCFGPDPIQAIITEPLDQRTQSTIKIVLRSPRVHTGQRKNRLRAEPLYTWDQLHGSRR